eukprot:3941344-Rhodomonas_salina.2
MARMRYATIREYARNTRCPVLTERIWPSPYARAMRCPVLTARVPGRQYVRIRGCERMAARKVATAICLRACYAMSGTDIAYGATSALGQHQVFSPYRPTHSLRDVRY